MTNVQPEGTDVVPYQQEIAPTQMPKREGQCLTRGEACTISNDCCSQWCVNKSCATRSP